MNPKPLAPVAAAAPPAAASGGAAAAGVTKFLKDCLAGTLGGISVVAVGHPFDTVKVRLQTQPTANPIYSGAIDCFKKTLHWEGVGGLYKGVASPLAGQMFFRATLFSAFGASKRWLGTNPDGSARPLTDADFFKAGFITGTVAAFTEGPIDFFKSQIQVQIIRAKSDPTYKPPFTTVLQCVRSAVATNGIRGPFQGLGPTILRNAPANAVYLGSFEVLKQRFAELQGVQPKDLSLPVVGLAGGLGGVLYWLAIFPVDVIKSAMMADAIDPAQRKYPNMVAAAKSLWAEGRLARFYRGFTPCLMRAVPANAGGSTAGTQRLEASLAEEQARLAMLTWRAAQAADAEACERAAVEGLELALAQRKGSLVELQWEAAEAAAAEAGERAKEPTARCTADGEPRRNTRASGAARSAGRSLRRSLCGARERPLNRADREITALHDENEDTGLTDTTAQLTMKRKHAMDAVTEEPEPGSLARKVRRIPLEQLREQLERDDVQYIGSGACGTCWLGTLSNVMLDSLPLEGFTESCTVGYVMELLPSGSLTKIISHLLAFTLPPATLPLLEPGRLASACGTLAADLGRVNAGEAGPRYFFRDISAGNLALRADGVIKVIDPGCGCTDQELRNPANADLLRRSTAPFQSRMSQRGQQDALGDLTAAAHVSVHLACVLDGCLCNPMLCGTCLLEVERPGRGPAFELIEDEQIQRQEDVRKLKVALMGKRVLGGAASAEAPLVKAPELLRRWAGGAQGTGRLCHHDVEVLDEGLSMVFNAIETHMGEGVAVPKLTWALESLLAVSRDADGAFKDESIKACALECMSLKHAYSSSPAIAAFCRDNKPEARARRVADAAVLALAQQDAAPAKVRLVCYTVTITRMLSRYTAYKAAHLRRAELTCQRLLAKHGAAAQALAGIVVGAGSGANASVPKALARLRRVGGPPAAVQPATSGTQQVEELQRDLGAWRQRAEDAEATVHSLRQQLAVANAEKQGAAPAAGQQQGQAQAEEQAPLRPFNGRAAAPAGAPGDAALAGAGAGAQDERPRKRRRTSAAAPTD
eukprot:scaffold11.g3975.t1